MYLMYCVEAMNFITFGIMKVTFQCWVPKAHTGVCTIIGEVHTVFYWARFIQCCTGQSSYSGVLGEVHTVVYWVRFIHGCTE